MTTANDIITDAFDDAGISAAETPLEAFMIKNGLKEFNNMAAEWELANLGLGLVPVENDSDTVRLARGHVGPVTHQLAIRLSSKYERPVSVELAAKAQASWDNLLKSLAVIGSVQFPDTLPIGSGNECPDITDDRFFPQNTRKNY